MKKHIHLDKKYWEPQERFFSSIRSRRELQLFNEKGGTAIHFDVMRSAAPDIRILGGKSDKLCLWETRASQGFITKPRFEADLITIRFVTSGHVVYRHQSGETLSSPSHATLMGLDGIREVKASQDFGATNGTIAVDILRSANNALIGESDSALPQLKPVAEVADFGIRALFNTVQLIQRRIQDDNRQGDLIFPLMQEIMSYQLLSAWPRYNITNKSINIEKSESKLNIAVEYIESNIAEIIRLADISAAAGISVRSLQDGFRSKFGQTPVQFIIARRLTRAHEDLSSIHSASLSIDDIARRWGFVHMSDFGQRYRRKYGCTPTETRRNARTVAGEVGS